MNLAKALELANVKTAVTRAAAVALVAGAAFLATPAKANAQVGFGVRVGPVGFYHGPVYHGPVYARPYGYYPPAPIVVGPAYGYGYYGPRYYGHPYWHHRGFYR